MENHLKKIIFSLINAKVQFVIAGGVAVVFQGVERLTMDIDIAVNMDRDNLRRFIDVMKELQLTPRAPISAESLLDKAKITMIINEKHALVFTFIDVDQPFRQVDLFLTNSHSYKNLIPDADIVKIQDYNVVIASKKKLIELKKAINPPRQKDLIDINELQKLLDLESNE